MAKLNPLLLLGGAAAALFVLSKKKGAGSGSAGSTEACENIDIGGMKLKDVMAQMQPNPADNPPELQAAMQKYTHDVIMPIAKNDKDVAELKKDFYGHLPKIIKRVAPACHATYEDLQSINEHIAQAGPGQQFDLKGQDPRTAFLVLFSTTLAVLLVQANKISFQDIMASMERLAGELE